MPGTAEAFSAEVGNQAGAPYFGLFVLSSPRECHLHEYGILPVSSGLYPEHLDPRQAHSRCTVTAVDAHPLHRDSPESHTGGLCVLGFVLTP